MRFHVGFSFRLKSLKKFLFPILIGILAYFGLGGLFGCINVYAYENLSTEYELTYNGFYENENFYHGNDSLTFVLYSAIDYYRNNSNNSNFEFFINQCGNNSMCLYLFQKTDVIKNVNIYAKNGSGYTRDLYSKVELTNNTGYSYRFIMPLSSNTNVLSSAWFDKFKTCVVSDGSNYDNDCLYSNNNSFNSSRYTSTYNTNLFYYGSMVNPPLIKNSEDFTFTNVNLYYYSSFDIFFRTNQDTVDSPSSFVKKVWINGVTSNISDRVFSYFDMINGYGNSIGNQNFDEYNQLNKIYVGSIPKSNINNFNLQLEYNYNSYDYSHSLNYNILYFGRTNHSTYYSYELLSCSSINGISSSVYDTTNKKTTTTILPNGFSCSSDLTNVDNIYLYIEIIPNGNFDNTIYNFDMYSNYGFSFMQNGYLSNFNGTYIYENFENLNPNFSVLLSTQDSSNNAYFRSYNQYIIASDVNRTNNSIGSVFSNPISFGITYNSNAMIYNIPSYYSGTSNLQLFIHYNTIVSFSDNDSYTYYDSSNNITTDTIINNKIVSTNTTKYNMTYYFGVVDSFLSDISLNIIAFSHLTQICYNALPTLIQTFIFVVFILFCSYFTYILIRK